jgi:hypothetical protein
VVRQGPAKLRCVERIAHNDREAVMHATDLFGRSHQGGHVMPSRQRLFDELFPNSTSGSHYEQSHFLILRKHCAIKNTL